MDTAPVIRWADQVRVRCPQCKIIIGNGDRVCCKKCGSVFIRSEDDTYQREA
jgi:phage FluMu protein Com